MQVLTPNFFAMRFAADPHRTMTQINSPVFCERNLATGEETVAIHLQNSIGRFYVHGQTLIEPKFLPCQIFARWHGQKLSKQNKKARSEFHFAPCEIQKISRSKQSCRRPSASRWLFSSRSSGRPATCVCGGLCRARSAC